MKLREIALSLGAKRSFNYNSASADVTVVAQLEPDDDFEEEKKRLHDKADRWLNAEIWFQLNRQKLMKKEREKEEARGYIHPHKTVSPHRR
jgi:hypothetical protein